MDDDPWAAATFAGTSAAQALVIARATPSERLAMLDALLELAEAAGVLRSVREQRQRAVDQVWLLPGRG